MVPQYGGVIPLYGGAPPVPFPGITFSIRWIPGIVILAALLLLVMLSIYGIYCLFTRSSRAAEMEAMRKEIESSRRNDGGY